LDLGRAFLALVSMFFLMTIYAAIHLCLLGLPLFHLLRWLRLDNWGSLSLAGLVVGSGPVAALGWPSRFASGLGWFEYFAIVGFCGLHGIIGALVFYWVWRRHVRAQYD